MNALLQREGFFLGYLLNTKNKKQRGVLLRTIDKRQLQALIELIYNALNGFEITNQTHTLKRYKEALRKLVSKKLSKKERVKLLLRYFAAILILLNNVKSKISVQWQKN